MREDQQERPFDPSPRRLEEARKRGDIPRSADLTAAAGWLGLVVALAVFGPGIVADLGGAGMILLGQADRIAAAAAPRQAMGGAILGGRCITSGAVCCRCSACRPRPPSWR